MPKHKKPRYSKPYPEVVVLSEAENTDEVYTWEGGSPNSPEPLPSTSTGSATKPRASLEDKSYENYEKILQDSYNIIEKFEQDISRLEAEIRELKADNSRWKQENERLLRNFDGLKEVLVEMLRNQTEEIKSALGASSLESSERLLTLMPELSRESTQGREELISLVDSRFFQMREFIAKYIKGMLKIISSTCENNLSCNQALLETMVFQETGAYREDKNQNVPQSLETLDNRLKQVTVQQAKLKTLVKENPGNAQAKSETFLQGLLANSSALESGRPPPDPQAGC